MKPNVEQFAWKSPNPSNARSAARSQSNFFPVLHIGTNTFSNATLKKATPFDCLITSDSGWNKIAFSNLPPDIQKQFGYDPVQAARELDVEKERERARRVADYQRSVAQQQADAAAATNAKPVNITAILADEGFIKCDTDQGTILIRYFPDATKTYFEKIKSMQEDIDALDSKVEQDDIVARRANAVALTGAGGDPAYVDAAMKQRAQANLLAEDVKTENDQLKKLITALKLYKTRYSGVTTLNAYPSGQKYGNEEIWNCLGIAPAKPAL